MRSLTLIALILISFILCASAQEKVEGQSANAQIVDYCTLRKNPALYNQETIRVQGIHWRSFEVSAFYDRACLDDSYNSRHETWVDNFFGAKICSDNGTAEIVKTFRGGRAGSEISVTLTGVFRGSKERGSFGHLGEYNFQIDVSCIDEAKLLPDDIYGCKRIDQTKPFHYLAFENVGKGRAPSFENSRRGKSEKLIDIRLVNNSTCSVNIPTVDGVAGRELEDGNRLPVVYTLTSQCRAVSDFLVTKRRQTLSVLSPGNSIFFSVPLRYLTKEPFIGLRIPFHRQRENGDAHYEPFYFWRYDLPENLRKDLDCTKF